LLYVPLRLPGSDISAEHLDQLLAVPFTTISLLIFAVGFARSREKVMATVDALNESKEVIRHMLYVDADTGLPSRHAQIEMVQRLVDAGAPFAVIGIFLRNYSQIYSNFGVQYGAAIVKAFIERVQEMLPPGYQLGKSLGMRFSILVTGDIRDETLERFAQQLLNRLKTPFELEDAAIIVQVSIGSAAYPADGSSIADVIRSAYIALTEAEQQELPAYCRFSQQLVERSLYQHWLDHNLRLAFERSEFALHYQPKVDLRDGSCNSVEAMGHTMRVAINISVQQLRDPDLLTKLGEAQALAGGLLDFELTESCFMSNEPHFLELIGQIRRLKFGIHLDDFGTGYSSLSRLKDLPLTVLKLDRVFVQDIPNVARGQKLLKAMIHLARELDLQVVAEGVETEEQANFLKAHGVEYAQGWLYAPAMAEDALMKWLAR
jgi:cyclic di-GMP phosphodiesterase Gmr